MSKNEDIAFEDALKQLEDIVRELEESGLTLDDALKKFETGGLNSRDSATRDWMMRICGSSN